MKSNTFNRIDFHFEGGLFDFPLEPISPLSAWLTTSFVRTLKPFLSFSRSASGIAGHGGCGSLVSLIEVADERNDRQVIGILSVNGHGYEVRRAGLFQARRPRLEERVFHGQDKVLLQEPLAVAATQEEIMTPEVLV